jgi:general stress protein 26
MSDTDLTTLFDMIEGIGTAMFTTRRETGDLVTRPMQTQPRAHAALAGGGDLWFVTDVTSEKLLELEFDPHVNLGYFKDSTKEWVSVSGLALISRDREAIRRVYQPDWKAWFGNDGPGLDGGPDDPRISLVIVDVTAATFFKTDVSRPVMMLKVVRAALLGDGPPQVGAVHHVTEREIRSAPHSGQPVVP